MASTERVQKWCAQVLAEVDKGTTDVKAIIAARNGARMSTLVAIEELVANGQLFRQGNQVWRRDHGLFPTHHE
jgi:glucose-6-phosphate dehydrogenase assembly protein OpcA